MSTNGLSLYNVGTSLDLEALTRAAAAQNDSREEEESDDDDNEEEENRKAEVFRYLSIHYFPLIRIFHLVL